jgi:hypothetical protein
MTQYYIRKSKKVGVMWYNGKNIDEAREFIGNGDIRLEMQPNGVLAIKYRAGFTRTIPPNRYILKGPHKTYWGMNEETFERQYTIYREDEEGMDMSAALHFLKRRGVGCVYRASSPSIDYRIKKDKLTTYYKNEEMYAVMPSLQDLLANDWRYRET